MTDKEKLLELINEIQTAGLDYSNISAVCKTSNETLVVHLVENNVIVQKHGAWKSRKMFNLYTDTSETEEVFYWVCPFCKNIDLLKPHKYCNNCGAKLEQEG